MNNSRLLYKLSLRVSRLIRYLLKSEKGNYEKDLFEKGKPEKDSAEKDKYENE